MSSLKSWPSAGSLVLLVVLVILLVGGDDDERVPEREERGDRSEQAGGRDPGPDREPRPERDEGSGGDEKAVTAKVVRVVDGDTIEVDVGRRNDTVRYIGVDTPESVAPGQPVECFAKRASAFNDAFVTGKRVRLEFGSERRDFYNRLLAYVYLQPGGDFVNEELIRRGYATPLAISPNTDFADVFERLADRAEAAGRGLWSRC